MSYNKMASVYDILMADAPYDQWVHFTEAMFKQNGKQMNRIIDLGCGTGHITCRLAKENYNIVGVDLSIDMLTHAKAKADKQHLHIDWIQQDLRALDGFENFDAAVSFCDVINYITEEEELYQVFQNVYSILNNEGLFIFDVHSLSHVENDLKDQTFAEIYDDISYVWFCHSTDRKGEVVHDLTFFIQDEDEKYERFDETHNQRTFSSKTYEAILEQVGFVIKGVYGDFSVKERGLDEYAERLFFVCQKSSR